MRALGSLTISAWITSLSGPPAVHRGTSPCTTSVTVASGSPCASYGGRPSTAANSVAPSDHRSAAGDTTPPEATSGAMNAGEPSTIPVAVMVTSETLREMPKSVSLICSFAPTSTFPGFTSRCVMPARCAACNALASASATAAACGVVSGPWVRSSSARLREGISSITTTGSPFPKRVGLGVGHARREPHLLDRDAALEHLVVGDPHGAHRSPAEHALQPVPAGDQAVGGGVLRVVGVSGGHRPIVHRSVTRCGGTHVVHAVDTVQYRQARAVY